MDGNGEAVCNDRQDAKRMLTIVKLDVLEKVEQVILLMEAEASSAPRIKWIVDSSGSAQSSALHLEGSSNASFLCNRAQYLVLCLGLCRFWPSGCCAFLRRIY